LRDTRRGRLYQLRDHTTIGRHLASSVIVQEPDVSRTHAEILRREDDYLLVPQPATVTSVNGARLLAPALLREGDEITVGRTVLRFTSAPPARSSVPSEPRRDGFGHDARQSQAQTMFIGRIEADELRSRDTRRRLHRFVAITVAALAIAATLLTMYSGTRAPATATATRRHQRAHI
jgi:predicted component of type VI protein secretion system